jgi:pimeloyl-ACP methyl ester carboxylesterase
MILKVGPGEFDKIGIHRVIKENEKGIPIAAPKAVMMLHGDASSFEGSFLASTFSDKVPLDHSIGIFLADKNIDVWGIDRRNVFIPDTTTEFSFMKNWNTEMHLDDIELAVTLARIVRKLSGSGSDKIFIMGHSRGAEFAYAYANNEAQRSESQQNLKGIIPVEMVYKFDPRETDLIQASCDRYQVFKNLYDSGIYYSDEANSLKYISYLASTDPEGPSPITGFTNKQAALFVFSATYATFAPSEPYVPYYHYLAGTFDENGIPTGLRSANFDFILDISLSPATPNFQSLGEIIDGEALLCDEIDMPYDDHLSEIKVPIFYVGTAGGFGAYGEYTMTLSGSTDKSSLIVHSNPPEVIAQEYGHADVLWADSAESLVWNPIYNWVNSSRH